MMSYEKKSPALVDTDVMPFGQHKGKLMQDVPPSYLKWLYLQIKQTGATPLNEAVFNYIHNSRDALALELGKDLDD